MITLNIIEVIRKSFTMVILIFCSIMALSFAIERWWFFRRIKLDVVNFMTIVRKYIEERKFNNVLDCCKSTQNPLARLVEVSIKNHQKTKSQLVELMNATRLEERLKMERFTIVLGTMGTICPFIGLFGTVIGIIKAFHDLAISGSGGPSVVAAGISEALLTTAMGLAIAIPSVVAFNYFMRKVRNIAVAMEANQIRILDYLKLD